PTTLNTYQNCILPTAGRRRRFGRFRSAAQPVAQTCSLSVSPEIVAAREDFFNHGWTRINTDEDRLSLIRVHPCSSVVGTYWLRLCRAALYRRFSTCRVWPAIQRVADYKSAIGSVAPAPSALRTFGPAGAKSLSPFPNGSSRQSA